MIQSSYYKPGKLFGTTGNTYNPTPIPVTPTVQSVRQPAQTPKPPPVQPQPGKPQTYQSNPNPNGKFMTGNVLNKAIDVVSVPYYGTAGFLRGTRQEAERLQSNARQTGQTAFERYGIKGIIDAAKKGVGNIKPAIENRTGISSAPGDYNAAQNLGIDNPYGQAAANFALGITVPNLAVGRVASSIGKFKPIANVANKVATSATNIAKNTPALYKPIEVVSPYFRNRAAGEVIQETENIAQQRINDLFKTLKSTSKGLTPAQQARVGQVLEGGITTNPAIQKIVDQIRPIIKQVGKEAEELGYLKPETLAKFKNGYMPHTFFDPDNVNSIFSTIRKTAPQVSGKFFKERKGAEGYIKQYAPAVFKGIGTEMKDVETTKGYRRLIERFGTKVGKDSADDASKYIDNQAVARIFKGYSMPNEIIDYINRSIKQNNPGTLGKVYDEAFNYWKKAKTIYNPAYHIRNLLSNQILSDMSTGRGIPRTITDYVKAVRQYRGKGDQRIVKIAENAGLIRRNAFYSSLDDFLKNAGLGQKKGVRAAGAKVDEGIRGFQQVMEDTSKLSVFKTWIKKYGDEMGVSFDDAMTSPDIVKKAAAKAEEAIFSPYRISPAERSLAARTIPFYSFARQALPFTAKTLAQNPRRISKYYRGQEAVESLSSDEGIGRGDRPKNLKGGIRLPSKDAEGRQKYFDPSYIYPFGNFTDFGFEGGRLPLGLSLNPFLNEFVQQTANRDFYFDQPIARSNIPRVARNERLKHATRTFEPAVVTTVRDKVVPAFQGKEDYYGRTRSKGQAVADAFGLRTQKASSAELRSKKNREESTKLRSFQNEVESIQNDNRLDAYEKNRRILELRELYFKE